MRPDWLLFLPLLATGCVAPPTVRTSAPPEPTPPIAVAAATPTKVVETRYEVRGYHEASSPDLRHEPHAVFRRTRVPAGAGSEFETVPRGAAPSLSDAPLPASVELAAELATQKMITAEIRALQTAMAETERQLQAQYARLVRQSAEVIKLREQLEAERQHGPGSVTGTTAAATPATVGTTQAPEIKW